jgi:hypothetical protein
MAESSNTPGKNPAGAGAETFGKVMPWVVGCLIVGVFCYSSWKQFRPEPAARPPVPGKNKEGTGKTIPNGYVHCDFCEGILPDGRGAGKSWNQKVNPNCWNGQCDACFGKGYLTPARVEEYRREQAFKPDP